MLQTQRARRLTLELCGRKDQVRLVQAVARWHGVPQRPLKIVVEEAFQGSKSHLGFEEPQGWSRQAVRRTAPLAMLLYSITVLWFAREGHALYKPPQRPWYRHKVRPSFADMLATLRYACLRAAISASPTKKQERQNLLLLLPDTRRAVAT